MQAHFLGTGWRLPVDCSDSRISTVSGEEAVAQSIWMILATARGERVMRPDFGCGIHDLVFHGVDNTIIGRVIYEVNDALTRWEPRIDVLDVSAEPDGAGNPGLLIRIDYRIRTTNNRFNLVYPFYIE